MLLNGDWELLLPNSNCVLHGRDEAKEMVGRWHLMKRNAQTWNSQGPQKPIFNQHVLLDQVGDDLGLFQGNACLPEW